MAPAAVWEPVAMPVRMCVPKSFRGAVRTVVVEVLSWMELPRPVGLIGMVSLLVSGLAPRMVSDSGLGRGAPANVVAAGRALLRCRVIIAWPRRGVARWVDVDRALVE